MNFRQLAFDHLLNELSAVAAAHHAEIISDREAFERRLVIERGIFAICCLVDSSDCESTVEKQEWN